MSGIGSRRKVKCSEKASFLTHRNTEHSLKVYFGAELAMSYTESGKKAKDKPRIVKRTWTEEEDAQVMLGPCLLRLVSSMCVIYAS